MNSDHNTFIKPLALVPQFRKPFFRTILVSRLNNATGWNEKVRSDIVYHENFPLENGALIETRTKMYSITTGSVIEKDGVKYYEVYPELYNYDQACIIYSALHSMKICNEGNKLKYAS